MRKLKRRKTQWHTKVTWWLCGPEEHRPALSGVSTDLPSPVGSVPPLLLPPTQFWFSPSLFSEVWPGLLCMLSRAAGNALSGQCQLGFLEFYRRLRSPISPPLEKGKKRLLYSYMTSCERNMETVGTGAWDLRLLQTHQEITAFQN